jgi:hypothetical protein
VPLAQAAQNAAVDEFYKTVASISFTLLGLWWVVIQLKFKEGAGEGRHRRHAYGVALYFLLPGVMTMLSSINSDLSLLWRLAFGLIAVLGILEIVLYLSSGGTRTRGPMALRAFSLVLYVLIAALALRPPLAAELGLGLTPREAEAVLIGGLIVVGVHLAWFGLTEGSETAGA